MSSLNEDDLRKLKYDKIKTVVSFIPIVDTGRLTFKMNDVVNKNYTFNDIGNGYVVPCFKSKVEVAKNVFSDLFSFEQTRIPGNYGTYNIVPKAMRRDKLNVFVQILARYPVFEGYFDNLYAVNKAYMEFIMPVMLYKILPFERINDENLIENIKNKDFTEYSFDDFADDDGNENDFKHF